MVNTIKGVALVGSPVFRGEIFWWPADWVRCLATRLAAEGAKARRDQCQCRQSSGRTAISARPVELETIVMAKYDVLSPNALGAILDDDTIPRLHARVIAGAATSRPDIKAAV